VDDHKFGYIKKLKEKEKEKEKTLISPRIFNFFFWKVSI
jgi:hypothetical protein